MFMRVTGLLDLSLLVGNAYYPRTALVFSASYQTKRRCSEQTGKRGFIPLFWGGCRFFIYLFAFSLSAIPVELELR